jgi:hypothetical protein
MLLSLALAAGRNGGAEQQVQASSSGKGAPPARSRFVVHEWGTFTNFAGADGVQLEFRPLVENDLPDFVYDRFRQDVWSYGKYLIRSLQRMETPVTYFYTDHERTVDVRVDFPAGLLTEFYPPVKEFGPEYDDGQTVTLRDSFLHWKELRVIPPQRFASFRVLDAAGQWVPDTLPEVTAGNHYAAARQTDSAIVEISTPDKARHHEKFLFYRGVGNFRLPLVFASHGQGRFTVTNFGPNPIESLFLVHIQGNRVRYSYHPEVAAHGVLHLQASSQDTLVEELAETMVAALVDQGLYAKEARAMVDTWRTSWFGEQGTRLLYMLPQPLTDEVLPIRIQPQPDELVRVMVGRMEILTPEHAQQITSLIHDLGTCVSARVEPLRQELSHLGRFAEPALQHIARNYRDQVQPLHVERLLAELPADQ